MRRTVGGGSGAASTTVFAPGWWPGRASTGGGWGGGIATCPGATRSAASPDGSATALNTIFTNVGLMHSPSAADN
jgi:ferric-dicitrate binding protein FerR (iron transport regulator)